MTRCPFAIWRPGPAWKVNAGPNAGEGIVLHSAEGSLGGTFGQLDSATAEVSWHFTVDLDGTLYQHYEIEAQCWHARSEGNPHFVGAEHTNLYTDGKPDHRPFTDEQLATDARLLEWLALQDAWPNYNQRDTLWEHNWLTSTSCPSSRIPWDDLYALLNPSAPPAPIPDGWRLEPGPFWSLYNGQVPWPVFRLGSNDGTAPGRISKLFGTTYLWLRVGENNQAYWSEVEGD